MTDTATRTSRQPAVAMRPARAAWLVVVVALVAIGAAYARARWPGLLPIGSDNDEYQLVGQALAAFEAPLVAGVEGTKYPLGYPAVLAVLQWLRLPVAPTALVINLAVLAGTVALVAHLAGRPTPTRPASPGAALAAGTVVAASVSVWNDAYSVMPELALLLVVSALLVTLQAPLTGRGLTAVVVLAIAAVSLKTLAILIVAGGFGAVWLTTLRRSDPRSDPRSDVASPRLRRVRPLLPVGAALVTVLGGMLAFRSLPEHTTGYLATFALRDPFDASQGTLGPGGLLARTVADVPATLSDLGRAIALIDAGTAVAVTVAVVGLGVGVLGAFRLRPGSPLGPFAAGAALAYALGMAGWPYHSSRFGIPLVPIAALGAGWLVRAVTGRLVAGQPAAHPDTGAPADTPAGAGDNTGDSTGDNTGDNTGDSTGTGDAIRHGTGPRAAQRHRWASVAVGGAVAVALVATSWDPVVDRGATASLRLAEQHAALDELARFAAEELSDERLVSFDYREVSHRLGRPVAPLAYTTDTDSLLAQVGDAEVVVMVDIHRTRNRQLELLLEAEPERFTPLLERDTVAAYRVEP